MSETIALLRQVANGLGSLKNERGDYGLADTAADEIEALRARLEKAEAERDVHRDISCDATIRAHGWMVAHDKLKAGLPYEFPKPADKDVALAIARNDALEEAAKYHGNFLMTRTSIDVEAILDSEEAIRALKSPTPPQGDEA